MEDYEVGETIYLYLSEMFIAGRVKYVCDNIVIADGGYYWIVVDTEGVLQLGEGTLYPKNIYTIDEVIEDVKQELAKFGRR